MKCSKCGCEFEPEIIEVGSKVDGDTELLIECPKKTCSQRFYTFAQLDWEPLED